ncbi:DUF4365 domain-containing protein [Gloeobacter violaceus]|uniref:Gll2739 protein n=1 Tax=Gloeobacter violaceus (strain ATCC 29082 / PCC 7421) TaxID=251221 RepID=Q7NGZ8_GLOVI|nr:DUF4365 domain-containing protein [Gloeobacter violaceus]BAC90680.1 gll2739 [Gloeobacter violaceus PCC 7421]
MFYYKDTLQKTGPELYMKNNRVLHWKTTGEQRRGSWGVNLNLCKEEFSYAYVDAVVAATGYSIVRASRLLDNQGIDIQIAAPGVHGTKRNPHLNAQVKCTWNATLSQTHVVYNKLAVKNYEELIDPRQTIPIILILVLVPDNDDPSTWLQHSEQALCMKRCGYWESLRNWPSTQNSDEITVRLPRTNVFDINGLKGIMSRIVQNGHP